ncbi:MAG: response regulator [Gemmatimonadales bacterium]
MATILIIDDNPDNMMLFRTLLALKGHRVVERSDGAGLLAALDEIKPDLTLMDIQLPERDGFALLKDIRGSAHRELRVLALTAHAMASDVERARQAGFDGYLTKPIDVRRFPELVARALTGERVEE